jgi:hypothetical protein
LNTQEALDLEEKEDEEDEEFQRWEMEQIRKGGGRPVQPIPQLRVAKPLPIQTNKITVEEFQKKLKMALQGMEERHQRDKQVNIASAFTSEGFIHLMDFLLVKGFGSDFERD